MEGSINFHWPSIPSSSTSWWWKTNVVNHQPAYPAISSWIVESNLCRPKPLQQRLTHSARPKSHRHIIYIFILTLSQRRKTAARTAGEGVHIDLYSSAETSSTTRGARRTIGYTHVSSEDTSPCVVPTRFVPEATLRR